MITETIHNLIEAIVDTDRVKALEIIRLAIEKGITPEQVVFDVILPATEQLIGSSCDDSDLSLAQHFIISQIAGEVTEAMIPLFKTAPLPAGCVVIGTSLGDFHGLGKKIVTGALKAQMVDVIDLGLNVPAHRFVEEAINRNAQIIAISSMMVHTARGENGPLKVRKLLKNAGLESQIKIVVGGAPYIYDEKLYRAVNADAWAPNGILAAKVIVNLINELKK